MAKYNKKTVDDICSLIRSDSYTIREICSQAGISVETFYEWQRTKPEFSEHIKKAKCEFDDFIASEARKSLVKLIQGYTVQEEKTVSVDSGKKDKNKKPIVKVKEYSVTDKYYQPVTAAVIFALTNRDPENWKNRQTSEHTGKDGRDLFEGFNPAGLSEAERNILLSIAENVDRENKE
jgi:DNA-binding CsgD family transcriptional regulator